MAFLGTFSGFQNSFSSILVILAACLGFFLRMLVALDGFLGQLWIFAQYWDFD